LALIFTALDELGVVDELDELLLEQAAATSAEHATRAVRAILLELMNFNETPLFLGSACCANGHRGPAAWRSVRQALRSQP